MFFKCAVCKEKDARLVELREQVSFLRSNLFPESRSTPVGLLEADGVLSGQQHVITVPDESEEVIAERSEADRILAGTYDQGV